MGPTLGMIMLHLTLHYLPDIMTAVTYNFQIEFDMFVRGKFCFKTNFLLRFLSPTTNSATLAPASFEI
jgi:hypothetical protein